MESTLVGPLALVKRKWLPCAFAVLLLLQFAQGLKKGPQPFVCNGDICNSGYEIYQFCSEVEKRCVDCEHIKHLCDDEPPAKCFLFCRDLAISEVIQKERVHILAALLFGIVGWLVAVLFLCRKLEKLRTADERDSVLKEHGTINLDTVNRDNSPISSIQAPGQTQPDDSFPEQEVGQEEPSTIGPAAFGSGHNPPIQTLNGGKPWQPEDTSVKDL